MKRYFFVLTAIMLCLALAACAAPAAPADPTAAPDPTPAVTAAPDPTAEPAPTPESTPVVTPEPAPEFTLKTGEEFAEMVSCSYEENADTGVVFRFEMKNLSDTDADSVTFSVRFLDANGDPVASNYMSNTEPFPAGAAQTYVLDHNLFTVYPTVADFTKEHHSIQIHSVGVAPDANDPTAYYELPFTEPIVIAIADIQAQ